MVTSTDFVISNIFQLVYKIIADECVVLGRVPHDHQSPKRIAFTIKYVCKGQLIIRGDFQNYY